MERKYGLLRISFIIADTHRSECEMQCTGNYLPYRKRTVKIRLTDEQMKELNISQVGRSHGRPVYEEILECFVDIVKG